ncbi:MAG: class I SAM-dependent methyltransferase [Gilvibacter sp.]
MDYKKINKDSWNKRTAHHFDSDFYGVKDFIEGGTSLMSIELGLLGDLTGKKVLHLQCHFGQDTISLERMGATVTGVDLSDAAIEKARELAFKTKSDARFICCDIYDLPEHLNEQFDLVFTSYGTIGWLPDINRWATIVSQFTKPNGNFVMAEFHPVVWMFDDDFTHVKYNYFNDGPIVESLEGTYAQKDADLTADYVTWNHSMSSVLQALIDQGLTINVLQEFDYSPYDCFSHTVAFEPKKFRIKNMEDKLPMVYAFKATKVDA